MRGSDTNQQSETSDQKLGATGANRTRVYHMRVEHGKHNGGGRVAGAPCATGVLTLSAVTHAAAC